MANKDPKSKIIEAYIDYVLTEGHRPPSVYAFAKANKMKEESFYDHFSSFDALEAGIWNADVVNAIEKSKSQEVWKGYSVREKLLSFFFTYVEILKTHRSFVVHSMQAAGPSRGFNVATPLKGVKQIFQEFCTELVGEGLETNELKDRKRLNDRYKDAMWAQFMFILNFWVKDSSAGFEKTDEAIEKGVNVTFDLIARNPIDNLIDYGKFLVKNAGTMQYERTK